jgi:hypothetical protein
MTRPLDLGRFRALLAAYGARPELFPEAERAAALSLLAASEEARALVPAESALDEVFSRAPRAELSPLLARKLAELPIRHPRGERRSRLLPVWTAVGWAAAAALGVLWGARGEAVDADGDATAEARGATNVAEEAYPLDQTDAELVELALGALPGGEEEP